MEKEDLSIIYRSIDRDIEINTLDEDFSYDVLLQAIKNRVEFLLERDPNLLFSYLYRLDVDESKLKRALDNSRGTNAIDNISDLIMNRQLERIETKKRYKQDPIEGWNW